MSLRRLVNNLTLGYDKRNADWTATMKFMCGLTQATTKNKLNCDA